MRLEEWHPGLGTNISSVKIYDIKVHWAEDRTGLQKLLVASKEKWLFFICRKWI